MGFDITFHPVALRELQHFVFDVVDDSTLLDERLQELTADGEVRAIVRETFDRTLAAISYEFDDSGFDPNGSEPEDVEGPADEAVRFLGAVVAGCLHPYWYARNAGLSFVQDPDVAALFQSFAEIGQGRIQSIPDPDGPWITGNSSATGFIAPTGVLFLQQRIAVGDQKLLDALGPEATEGLRNALAYASDRQLGLVEATDVFTAAGSISDPGNLRDFPRSPSRAPVAAPRTPIKCPTCGLFNQHGSERCDCGYVLPDIVPVEEGSVRLRHHGRLMVLAAIVLASVVAYAGHFSAVAVIAVLFLLLRGLHLSRTSS